MFLSRFSNTVICRCFQIRLITANSKTSVSNRVPFEPITVFVFTRRNRKHVPRTHLFILSILANRDANFNTTRSVESDGLLEDAPTPHQSTEWGYGECLTNFGNGLVNHSQNCPSDNFVRSTRHVNRDFRVRNSGISRVKRIRKSK